MQEGQEPVIELWRLQRDEHHQESHWESEKGKRLETLVAWLTECPDQHVCNVEDESSMKPGE